MPPLSRSARISLRLAGLALVNGGVYLVYVRAIQKAKNSGVRGTLHQDGNLNYDGIVRAAYENYVGEEKEE